MVAEGLGTFVAVRCEIPIMFTMGLGLFLVGALGFLVGLPWTSRAAPRGRKP